MSAVKIQICILLSLTLICELNANKKELTWQNSLFNYIKNESRVYETNFFIDNKQTLPPTIENFVQYIYKTLPAKIFTDLKIMTSRISTLNSDSSLFIVITFFEQRNNIKELSKFISSIAKNKKRPKLLAIVYYNKKTNSHQNSKAIYHKLLQSIWLMDLILDVTLLEVLRDLNLKSKNRFNDIGNRESTLMYCYNPYLDITTENNVTWNSWFPDKMMNLNGHSLKVGFHNYPPDIGLKLNKSGDIHSLSGFSALKMTTLSERMNFRLEKTFISNWGTLSCNKKKIMGFYRKLLNNEIQVTAVEHPRYSLCDEKLYEFSKGTKIISISLVVPEITSNSALTSNEKALDVIPVLQVVVVLIILVSFMWIISHLLHFDLREWHAIYMIQLVLNTTTPHKPAKIEERVVFASMMWACFFHSSYIYMSFTDIGLNNEEKSLFQTVQDVLNSEIEVIIDNNYAEMLYNNSDGDIKKLLNKAQKMRITEEECITQMIENKNLTCVAREDHARYIIGNIRDKCGKQIMKILDETLWVFVSNTYLAPASPFVKRFDTIIQRFIESGMEKKWQISNSSDIIVNEERTFCASGKAKIDYELNNLLVILIFGYMSCSTSFIAEVIMKMLLKKFRRNRCLMTFSKIFH